MLFDEINKWLYEVKFYEIKQSSFDRLEITILNNVLPRLSDVPIESVTTADVQNLINDMYTKGYSYSTIKKAFEAINAFFNYELLIQRIDNIPTCAVKLPKKSKFPAHEMRFFNNDEIQKIKYYCNLKNKKGDYEYSYGQAFLLMLQTGIRVGEALALSIDDADICHETLKIRKNKVSIKNRKGNKPVGGYKSVVQQPKTPTSIRDIPLNIEAIKCINSLVTKSRELNSNFLICNSNGNVPSVSQLEKSFYRILKVCNIQKCGLHTLRHTYASRLFENNIDIKTISAIMGHNDIRTTSQIYIHFYRDHFDVKLHNIII